MQLLRQLVWIAAVVLALTNWFMKEQWLGDLWKIVMGGLVVTLVALTARLLLDWKRNRELAKELKRHQGKENSSSARLS